MRRLLPPVLFAVAVLLGWLLWREAGIRALAEVAARIAADSADSAARRAEVSDAEAAKMRAERDQYRRATDAASRRVTETTRTASEAARTALDAARDSSVTADSLRAVADLLARAWTADSIAQAEREATWIRRAMHLEAVITSDSVAIRDLREALLAEQRSHMASKAIGRRSFLGRLAQLGCTVAIVGGAAELGSKVSADGGAAIGGVGGYLASTAICR